MLHQQGLDTTTPAGKAMFQMMGVFAEFERAVRVGPMNKITGGISPCMACLCLGCVDRDLLK
jgi:hypothetical protein